MIVKTKNNIPLEFNKDSAYAFVERQVRYGPRVPNMEAHRVCARHITNKLEQFLRHYLFAGCIFDSIQW